jgi:cell division protein FtsW
MWMTRRIMHIGRQSIALDRLFAGLVAQGVGIWMGFQTFINIGVNLGALPTKGLTLPLDELRRFGHPDEPDCVGGSAAN